MAPPSNVYEMYLLNSCERCQNTITFCSGQGFPHMLRTWGRALKKFDGGRGGLESIHGGRMGGPKTVLKI